MSDTKNKKDRLALLALGLDQSVPPAGTCPDSMELAALLHSELPEQRKEELFAHFGSCEKCYEEWLTLSELAKQERQSTIIRPFLHRRILAGVGSALAVAACVMIFFALPYTQKQQAVVPMFKNGPNPQAENDTMLSAPAEDRAADEELSTKTLPPPAALVKPAEQAASPAPAAPPMQNTLKEKQELSDSSAEPPPILKQHRAVLSDKKLKTMGVTQETATTAGRTLSEGSSSYAQFLMRIQQFCTDPKDQSLTEIRDNLRHIIATSEAQQAILVRLQNVLVDEQSPVDKQLFCEQARRIISQSQP
jgi:hypothetical protein